MPRKPHPPRVAYTIEARLSRSFATWYNSWERDGHRRDWTFQEPGPKLGESVDANLRWAIRSCFRLMRDWIPLGSFLVRSLTSH